VTLTGPPGEPPHRHRRHRRPLRQVLHRGDHIGSPGLPRHRPRTRPSRLQVQPLRGTAGQHVRQRICRYTARPSST